MLLGCSRHALPAGARPGSLWEWRRGKRGKKLEGGWYKSEVNCEAVSQSTQQEQSQVGNWKGKAAWPSQRVRG